MFSKRDIEDLIEEIASEVAATAHYTGRAKLSDRVYDAMRAVPRDQFVPQSTRGASYGNYPLSIGHGQTISQPYIVALMTDMLDLDATKRVLEVGTGSGYQAAVLAEIAGEVYSVEIIGALAESAEQVLKSLDYTNIHVRQGDGYHGWVEHAPYDGIIVTACASAIPADLRDQLKPGGRMMIPLGAPYGEQELVLLTKDDKGNVDSRSILPVAFVPLTGEH